MPIALVPALDPLLAFIASGEGDYNSMNQGTRNGKIVGSTHNAASVLGKNLTDMTIAEVMEHQAARRLFAAGRYQIIPITMQGTLASTGLTPADRFDRKNQDRFGVALAMQRKAARDYLTGKSNNREAALLALAQVWASLPDPRTGNSFYGSGNKSLHSVEDFTRVVDETRAALARAGGVSADSSAGGAASTTTTASGSLTTLILFAAVGLLAYRRFVK